MIYNATRRLYYQLKHTAKRNQQNSNQLTMGLVKDNWTIEKGGDGPRNQADIYIFFGFVHVKKKCFPSLTSPIDSAHYYNVGFKQYHHIEKPYTPKTCNNITYWINGYCHFGFWFLTNSINNYIFILAATFIIFLLQN